MENASKTLNQNLLISIFVPVFNGEKYLVQTLKSIQEQTYTNLEILLVDDSSTDESLKILNQFAKEDSRFNVFVKENGGMVAKSMNFILPKISGDYFFTVHKTIFFQKI
jgi:glycosyltransferase involved in cell wall biosynthesis